MSMPGAVPSAAEIPKIDFEYYNNFETLSSEEVQILEHDLQTNYRRKTSVIVFRHGHRTPFKCHMPGFSGSVERCFYASNHLDLPSWFAGKSNELYTHVQLHPYAAPLSSPAVQSLDLNLQFNINYKIDGMLTKLGAVQLRKLGKNLSKRYQKEVDHVISKAVSSGTEGNNNNSSPYASEDEDTPSSGLLAVSTRTERTIESLCGVLKGLFEGSISKRVDKLNKQKKKKKSETSDSTTTTSSSAAAQNEKTAAEEDEQAMHPVVRIFVFTSIEQNWLFVPYRQYPELMHVSYHPHLHEFKAVNIPGYTEWVKSVIMKHNLHNHTQVDLQLCRDYSSAYRTFNLDTTSPPLDDDDFSALDRIATYSVAAELLLVERGVAKSSAMFFQALIQLLSSHERCLNLLSAHDTTIIFIQLALRAQDYNWPDFGYNIEFELFEHTQTGELSVLVLFDLQPVLLRAISPQSVLIPFKSLVSFVNQHIHV